MTDVPEPEVVTVFLGDPGRVVEHGQVATLWYGDGSVGIRHHCVRSPELTVVCAPKLTLGSYWKLVTDDPVTITPSIMCPDCGLHGFITDGVWIDA